MKKIIFVILAVIALSFSSCGKNTNIKSSSGSEKLSAKQILSKIQNKNLDAAAYLGDSSFDDNAEKLFGISVDEISDGGILYAQNGGLADEVTVLKTNLDTNLILKDRISSRLTTFENYKPEEIPKIKSAEIIDYNDYHILIISDNNENIKKQIGIDN